jgi:hypothetical protein
MIAVDKTLISDDIITVKFICNLDKCLGACCVDGDAGAPLEEDEISIIEDAIDEIKPYMVQDGIEVIEKNGVFDYDMFGHFVTPLVHDRECAFVYFENEIAFCAIEKAYREGKISFCKPISCHLYPIRTSGYRDFEALNYHEWPICDEALKNGKVNNVPLYVFLKDALTRKYGQEWYDELVKTIHRE